MKRIQRRSGAALLLAFLLLLGTAVLLWQMVTRGGQWASYSANISIYSDSGILSCGTLTDRNGIVLAESEDGEYRYAEDATVRMASLHTVGDYEGHIGGALKAFAQQLTGYHLLTGTTQSEGNTVALTLDAALQKTAWNALRGQTGCVLVTNYESGEVLCLVSSPSYDPYGEPDESIDGLYINRALGGVYTPGSVFKTVTLCAAIENIPDLFERSFSCTGRAEINGGTIVCGGRHGTQTIEAALANSCNCTFGALAMELGGETLARYAEKLGFTSAHSLDGITTAAGHFDAVESRDAYLAWSGIGQHTDLVNPYAMVRYLSAIANGGTVTEPILLLGNNNGSTRLLRQETAEKIDEMMSYTFTTHYAPSGAFPGLDLCAKTGTAELGDGSSHSWFVGYTHSGPPLAFAVCIERGGEGFANAAKVASAVLQEAVKSFEF